MRSLRRPQTREGQRGKYHNRKTQIGNLICEEEIIKDSCGSDGGWGITGREGGRICCFCVCRS